jgi:hypothetical protein
MSDASIHRLSRQDSGIPPPPPEEEYEPPAPVSMSRIEKSTPPRSDRTEKHSSSDRRAEAAPQLEARVAATVSPKNQKAAVEALSRKRSDAVSDTPKSAQSSVKPESKVIGLDPAALEKFGKKDKVGKDFIKVGNDFNASLEKCQSQTTHMRQVLAKLMEYETQGKSTMQQDAALTLIRPRFEGAEGIEARWGEIQDHRQKAQACLNKGDASGAKTELALAKKHMDAINEKYQIIPNLSKKNEDLIFHEDKPKNQGLVNGYVFYKGFSAIFGF